MTVSSSGDDPGVSRGRAAGTAHPDRQRKNDRQQANDRSSWNWLLLPAIVVPLLVPLYNRVEPTLFGWPFFYWVQLAFIALGVTVTTIVYQKTKTRKSDAALRNSGRASVDEKGR